MEAEFLHLWLAALLFAVILMALVWRLAIRLAAARTDTGQLERMREVLGAWRGACPQVATCSTPAPKPSPPTA